MGHSSQFQQGQKIRFSDSLQIFTILLASMRKAYVLEQKVFLQILLKA